MFGSAMGLGFTALGLASGLWAAATARFMMPNVVNEPPNRFKAGLPADYPPGFVETKYKERYGVWVVHGVYRGKRQIYALRTVCTHLGCITNWQPSENRFKAGLPGDYPPGFVETRYKERYGVWVVHGVYRGKRQIYALRTVCTHVGCITTWQPSEKRFKCPCHGSGFYADGVNFEGPAPRALERYAIRLADDGQLEIDKARAFREELGQWTDPACFVEG